MIVIGENNTTPQAEEIYAFLSKDDKGNEGLCAYLYQKNKWMPFVAINQEQLAVLMPVAEKIAEKSNKDVVLVKFNNREEIKRFVSKEKQHDQN